MKEVLLSIADKIDERVKEFDAFPRTQATDAMKGIGTDIAKIIREEATEIDETSIEDQVSQAVADALESLTAPPKKVAPKKSNKRKDK